MYRKNIQAGENAYDVFFGTQYESTVDAMNGLNAEFKDLPYIDLKKPWWDDGISDISYGGKVYFAAGDITWTTAGYTTLLLFNKNLFSKNNIPFPYEDVKAGKWTYAKFAELIKDLSRDLNGDGKMRPDDDMYSITGWQYETPYNFLVALGSDEISKDLNGYPNIAVFEPKTISAMEKVLNIYKNLGGWISDSDYNKTFKVFTESRSWFCDLRFIELYNVREMQDDFGMIPHPKLDESVPHYTQLVNSNVVTVTAVPVTNDKLEMTSILLEALAYEGKRLITPEYKEILLKTKLTRDDESADMFDYIWGHRTYRYAFASYASLFMNLIVKGNDSFVSEYEKFQGKAETEIEKIMEIFFSK
jgi:hypothetical protein